MKKKQLTKYALLFIVLVVGVYFIVISILPVSNPFGNDWIGICVHSLSVNEARLVNESGAGWVRIDVFNGFGVAVTIAKAYNLSVLGILDSWTLNNQITFILEEWRSNVTYYVSQYADYVDAWEIWNEPANPTYPLLNVTVQENMGRIVEFYLSMVQIASSIIRQYDPSAKIVLFGGLNLWSGGDPHLALDKKFAQKLAAMNIEQYGDALSVHAYSWGPIESKVWKNYGDSLRYYRELFISNKSLEIWVTEIGYPIEFGGEEGQAQYMRSALQYFQGKVARFFWYSLLDNPADQKSFGLIGNETPRLAYYILQKQLTDKSK